MTKHILHAFSTFAVGGQQTRFLTLCNATKEKYRHTIIAMDGNYEAASGLAPHVNFTLADMPVSKTGGISLANLRQMREQLATLRPDLLCTYNWGSIEWSLANLIFPVCPQIHIEDGFGPDESPTRQHPRRTITRRLLLSRCARIVVPSTVLRDVALNSWKLNPARILYLPNGIDCARFGRAADETLLADLGIAPDDVVVGTVAALRPEKNLERLLRIFAATPPNPKTRLVIVGDGAQRAFLTETANTLGIAQRTIFTGALAAPERILARFNIFALSSNTEQMPNSVLEAMAAGLPILATDVGDVKR
ncbi:MAG TPA: glycosyltransferase family 4 protein, partial [Rhizomicrobium sp.]|nr:glycosyltransferase family 4 protein [Rhizomicrobium sp.]